MSRLFIYDENMTDERAKITVAKMAAISDIVAPEKKYIQYSAQGAVTIMAGCVIAVGENAVFKTAETVLTKANLDQGSDFVLLYLHLRPWDGRPGRTLFDFLKFFLAGRGRLGRYQYP